MDSNILIIKLGAMGDVLRTTPLLGILKGKITWLLKKESLPILEGNPFIGEIIDIDTSSELMMREFDLVINLDDDSKAAELATRIKKRELIGTFLKNGKIVYTDSSSPWFDTGLVSKFGIDKANQLKKKNRYSYQEIIFKMLGKKFNAEEYVINYNNSTVQSNQIVIGIEDRVGDKWLMKRWDKYVELGKLLQRDGYSVKFLKQRNSIQEYIKDISQCDIVVSGDTLAMHVALALKKKAIAIFTCTSPYEIFDYGRMIKVANPLLYRYFYKRGLVKEAVSTISLDTVYRAIKEIERLNGWDII